MLPLVLSLSGCFYQTVNLNDIQTAIKACDSLENIVEIQSEFIGAEKVRCIDRTVQWLDEDVWKVK
jgi:hypothetical protein